MKGKREKKRKGMLPISSSAGLFPLEGLAISVLLSSTSTSQASLNSIEFLLARQCGVCSIEADFTLCK